jgi:hypothetical protein
MASKQGNLHIRKGTSRYGPMWHADLEKLLAAGRLAPTDQVSVSDGPWMSIGHYLATAPHAAQPSAAASGWKEAPSGKQDSGVLATLSQPNPCLHIVHENRKYPAMTRQQVKGLLDSARLSGDDLICAIDGPWMRVADFFAKRGDSTPSEAWAEVEVDEEDIDDLEEVFEEYPASPLGASAVRSPAPVPLLSDQWYVKVRGLHSMNLQKHHLKTLLAIREITIDNPVRHVHWDDEGWQPLREIPQLADLVK